MENKVIEKENSDGFIVLKNINKIYDNNVQAVTDFNLDIKKHEFIVLVGPSGCGKSTTIRMIAGLEEISSGELYIDGKLANDLEPKDRDLAMVFQSYALYPHMSVYDNLAFGLRMKHTNKNEIDKRVHEVAKILEIEQYLKRKPKFLSGGQRQRVALGRAIIRNAKLFLMDEPLSNLDAKLRVSMRSEIIKLHDRLDATMIYVTHDQTEAMTMATRIVVMKDGFIQQIGTPIEIYNHPNNAFVATFIGSPSMNLIEANYNDGIIEFNDGNKFDFKDYLKPIHDDFYKKEIEKLNKSIPACDKKISEIEKKKNKSVLHKKVINLEYQDLVDKRQHALDLIIKFEMYIKTKNHPIIFGIRPEDIHQFVDTSRAYKKSNDIKLKVSVPELLGHEYYVHSEYNGTEIIAKINSKTEIKMNDEIVVNFDLDMVNFFEKDTRNRF